MSLNKALLLCIATAYLASCESPLATKKLKNNEPPFLSSQLSSQTHSLESFDLTLEFQWAQPPQGRLDFLNILVVFMRNQDGVLVSLPEGHTLDFYATMPSMGHPLADPGFFDEVNPGLYLNKNIVYNMPGDWKNDIAILDQNDDVVEQVIWDEFL